MKYFCILLFVTSLNLPSAATGQTPLQYQPAPADNPLKGFVPYVEIDGWNRFPHSMEFHYFSMRELMPGANEFDWSPIEKRLRQTQQRGCQLTFRVMLEYPGHPICIPQFLIDGGLRVTRWKTDNTYEGVSHTPDYEDPQLKKAMADFIAALGKKYDGDPRISFLTAGLLGSWGEWHTYPRDDLWASKETQIVVLDAFQAAFRRTPVLLRYPAKPRHYAQADNSQRPFGYHDDSFNWATLDTGRKEDNWFFMPLVKAAGVTDKWKSHPIGGELRPELWKDSFTSTPHPRSQGFAECVRQTHATWLMDSGLFENKYPLPPRRKEAAIKAAQLLGYEFHVSHWQQTSAGQVKITVENRGVAPFYHDWPVELWSDGQRVHQFDLRKILPGERKIWTADGQLTGPFRLRVPNPMPGGKPLRFANREQNGPWLELP